MSFLSPCVLPIVPGYLSVVCGVSLSDLQTGGARVKARILRDTALFVAGFGAVFVALGLSATALGDVLFRNQEALTRVSGIVLLVMAGFLGAVHFGKVGWLMGEWRLKADTGRFGILAAPVAGIGFGFGWTPCIGPVLASVLTVAAGVDTPVQGGLLLAVYSLGMGIPFVLTGLAFGKASAAFSWVRRHYTSINLVAIAVLVVFGLLLATDQLTSLTLHLQDAMRTIGLDRLVELG